MCGGLNEVSPLISGIGIFSPQLVARFGEAQEGWPCWRKYITKDRL